MGQHHRIVVGVDGTPGGRAALEWAMEEAADRGASLHVVAAWRPETGPAQGREDRAGARRRATTMLAGEIEALPGRPDVAITTEVGEGRPGEVLVEAAREADMLVLGSHGHGRLWHTVVGWTSEECARTASCPVVLVPLPQRAGTK